MEKEDKIGLTLAYVGLLIITLIGIVSAEIIFAGDCNSIEFSNNEAVNFSVEGNSSDMNGFSYEKNGTNITYCFHPLYKSDNFTITFYNYQSVEVLDEVQDSSGGGGYYTYPWRKKNETETNETETEIENKIEEAELTEPEPTEPEEKSYLKWWIIGIISLFVLIICVYLIIKKLKIYKSKNPN